MRFEINMVVEVDEDSNILEVDRQGNQEVVLDLVRTAIYDLDELSLKNIEVEQTGV